MSAITIEMEDEQIAGLKETANRYGFSVETLARKVLTQLLESERDKPSSWVDSQTFERALQDSLRENDELYRRLAK